MILVITIFYVVIIVHELSHFFVAKWLGFEIPVFGIGLPVTPHIAFLKTEKTEFRMHLIPIGAYAEIPDLDPPFENEDDEPSSIKSARRFPLVKKIAVVLAGPIACFVLGVSTLTISLMTFGYPVFKLTIQDLLESNPIAARAGVKPGDEIVGIDAASPQTIEEAVQYFSSHAGIPLVLHLRRDGKELDIMLIPNQNGKVGILLASPYDKTKPARRLKFPEALSVSAAICQNTIEPTVRRLETLFSFEVPPASERKRLAKLDDEGAIGMPGIVFQSRTLISDPYAASMFASLVPFAFGLIYMLPIPGLDGAHLISVINNHYSKSFTLKFRAIRWLRLLGIAFSVVATYVPCLLRGRMPKGR